MKSHKALRKTRMIPAKSPGIASKNDWEGTDWRAQWRDSFTVLDDLLTFLQLNRSDFVHPVLANPSFQLRVPRSFAERMRKADPFDPLLLQVLPQMLELLQTQGFSADPVNDLEFSPVAGLIHKYRSRALLISTGACAVNCRYCFRRSFPYADAHMSEPALQAALAYVQAQPEIDEVILSGGDPLALSNSKLFQMIERFAEMSSIRRIRIHTRTPVVLPARIDADFLRRVNALKVPIVMVLHSNHANEWRDADLNAAMAALKSARVSLLNQAVLLAGVNDTPQAQIDLSEALFAAGVMPYYLNLLDRVQGSAHFEVTEVKALELYTQIRAALPGYLLPRLVRDIPGQISKSLMPI
jgi:L-lysine 2,3-aminomutase